MGHAIFFRFPWPTDIRFKKSEGSMLSQKAKYALKALLALAKAPEGELLQAGEIALQENVPKKFLDLILLECENIAWWTV